MENLSFTALIMVIICGAGAVFYAVRSIQWMPALDAGSERMQEIAGAIEEGARAYLKRQYRTILFVGVIFTLLLAIFIDMITAFGFIVGASLSAATGFVSMNISVQANVRTAEAAKQGLNSALQVAFRGGANRHDGGWPRPAWRIHILCPAPAGRHQSAQ